ncbi:MAG: hypothetical protein KA713_15885 [Chryseotalea sp. WA131a]|jgi:hypothetical protein|nr:MAG: hypothetical protein KA713_15885 [Chryseotalea sp. WA131a]
MKKIRFALFLSLLLVTVFGLESNGKAPMPETAPAISCKVYGADGSEIGSCWFCNCRAFASKLCGCQM